MARPSNLMASGHCLLLKSAPLVNNTFILDSLQTWETLDDDSARVTMATGAYTTYVDMTEDEANKNWAIDLGDVRESARVYINDSLIGCAWSVPFCSKLPGCIQGRQKQDSH